MGISTASKANLWARLTKRHPDPNAALRELRDKSQPTAAPEPAAVRPTDKQKPDATQRTAKKKPAAAQPKSAATEPLTNGDDDEGEGMPSYHKRPAARQTAKPSAAKRRRAYDDDDGAGDDGANMVSVGNPHWADSGRTVRPRLRLGGGGEEDDDDVGAMSGQGIVARLYAHAQGMDAMPTNVPRTPRAVIVNEVSTSAHLALSSDISPHLSHTAAPTLLLPHCCSHTAARTLLSVPRSTVFRRSTLASPPRSA